MRLKTKVAACASSVLALGGLSLSASPGAFAYGSADNPVAQVEISANCDSASFSFCTDVVGLGGVWAWAELDNVPSSTAGWNEMDATISECQHTQGGGGPGSAGASGGPDSIGVWAQYPNLGAALGANPGAIPLYALFGANSDYTGSVYVLDFFPGAGSQDFEPVVPTQVGHYSVQPVPGATVQIQVAP